MKTYTTIIIALAGLMTAPFAFAAGRQVAVATLYWEPYITTNTPSGGAATEIVRTAFARGRLEASIAHMPWKDAIDQTRKGIYHAIYPAYFSLERAGQFLISDPFLSSPVVLVARADADIRYDGLASLKPYRIAVVAGYANAEAFDDADYLNKIVTQSDLENLEKLNAGLVDLAAADKLVALALIRKHPDKLGTLEDYRILAPVLGNRDMYVMFPKTLKTSARRLKAFNKGLKRLRREGRIEAIIQAHGFR